MSASGAGAQPQQQRPIFRGAVPLGVARGEHLELGVRVRRAGHDPRGELPTALLHPVRELGALPDGPRQRAPGPGQDERRVALVDLSPREELLIGAALLGTHPEGEHPGGATVQAVQRHQLLDPGVAAQADQGAGEHMGPAWHGRHVMGLVDHQQVLVAEEDRQRLGRHLLRAQLAVEPQLVAGADGIVGRPRAPAGVDHLPGGEALGQRRGGRVRKGGETCEEHRGRRSDGSVPRHEPAHRVQTVPLRQRGREPAGAAAGGAAGPAPLPRPARPRPARRPCARRRPARRALLRQAGRRPPGRRRALRRHSPHTAKVSTLWPM